MRVLHHFPLDRWSWCSSNWEATMKFFGFLFSTNINRGMQDDVIPQSRREWVQNMLSTKTLFFSVEKKLWSPHPKNWFKNGSAKLKGRPRNGKKSEKATCMSTNLSNTFDFISVILIFLFYQTTTSTKLCSQHSQWLLLNRSDQRRVIVTK